MRDRNDFLQGVGRIWFAMKRVARKRLAERGSDLGLEQIMILHILADEDGVRIKDIADKADRDRTTTSRMIDGLEKRGLVVRVPDKQDNRQKLVYLTRQAKERLEQLDRWKADMYTEMFGDIDPERLKDTAHVLHSVAENIENM